MSQSDCAAVCVEPVWIRSDRLQPGQRYRSKRLIDLIEVDIGDFHTNAPERPLSGGNRLFQHDQPDAGCHRQLMNSGQWSEIVCLERFIIDHQDPRSPVADLARIGRRDHPALLQRPDRPYRYHGSVVANTLVLGIHFALAVAQLDRERNYFIGKRPILSRRGRTSMTLESECVEIRPHEAVLFRNHLRTPKLTEVTGSKSILDPLAEGSYPDSRLLGQRDIRTHRNPRHALHACRDDHVLSARHDRLRRKMDRLLGRSALPIDRDAGDALRKLRRENGIPSHGESLFTHRRDAPKDDILYDRRIDSGAIDESIVNL